MAERISGDVIECNSEVLDVGDLRAVQTEKPAKDWPRKSRRLAHKADPTTNLYFSRRERLSGRHSCHCCQKTRKRKKLTVRKETCKTCTSVKLAAQTPEKRLKLLLIDRGLELADVSRGTGLSLSLIEKVATMKKRPTRRTVARLEAFIGCRVFSTSKEYRERLKRAAAATCTIEFDEAPQIDGNSLSKSSELDPKP
jgi:transcriptional regulator with XRE-family HTH domain